MNTYLALALAILLLGGCGSNIVKVQPNDSKTMARITSPDGVPAEITVGEFSKQYEQANAQSQAQGQTVPAERILQDLLGQKLAQAIAQREGIGVDGSEVDEQLAQLAARYNFDPNSFESFSDFARQNNLSSPQEVRRIILNGILLHKVVANDAQELGMTGARHILFGEGIDPQKPEAEQTDTFQRNKELANQIYSQLKSGGNFAALAREHSTDPGSAERGGDLGPVQKGQMVQPFDQALFSLKQGEISQPVKSQYGWHVIQRLPVPIPVPGQLVRQWLDQQLQEGRIEVLVQPEEAVQQTQ